MSSTDHPYQGFEDQADSAVALQDAGEFTACPTPENGRASCVATDSDFLGMAYTHKETVKCGVVCDEVS